ncbi:hypothetical protein OG874_22445 [Nocardia sp. NBC_00565]|uniref:hypothetical protein n=1 Tax=Nocardia sp. NBC_00565 TaxID=2975993 RepID=UPI002E806ECC|nr:hypothetical protein [Nocardia sp. NBC_00565]WUC07679.1 hypothetical protein OG874_22445 [Nocardia sp. NBC_00565]
MEPERESPYWKAIVGENWPVISPGDWSALETSARDGADALDPDSLERARRGFDDTVRASIGLQPVKDDMRAQQWHPRAFADALNAAADTFGEFADRVHRTRNRILDIVEEADRRIEAAPAAEPDEDGEADDAARAARIQQRINNAIAEAKAEVEDVVRSAVQTISPTGLPWLQRIADELGQPGPGEAGSSDDQGGGPTRRHGPDGHHPGGRHPGDHHPDARHPGVHRPDAPLPGLPTPLNPDVDLGPGMPQPTDPAPAGAEPAQVGDGQQTPGPVVAPAVSGLGPTSTSSTDGIAAVNYSPTSAPGAGDETSTAGSDLGVSSGPASTDSTIGGATTDASASAGGPSDAAELSAETGAADGVPDAQMPFAPPLFAGGGAAAGAVSAGAPGAVSSAAAPTGSTVSAPSSQTRQPVSMTDSRGAVPDVRSSAPDQRVAAAGPSKVTAVSGNSAGVSAAPTKQPLPNRNTEQEAAHPNSGHSDTAGSDELIRDAVGAAMLSAAAPAFVLGERVDGDLMLARTILGGVLAAIGPSTVGLSWAVSVLRHTGGVSAFVTSNEGRGWIPAGLFLPREISTPWQWSESDGASWEGIADPARVLVEFGLAWGRKSGARISALASSQAIDPDMRGQLGQVPMAGEVAASTAMDLGSPGAGLVDRLGLVAAPQMLERVSGFPVAQIGARCTELAADAHVRLGKSHIGAAASLGAPQLRERILVAIKRGASVAEAWWDELRDADDLLAASMLALRTDVSRVALGELRSEHTDGRSGSDAATLRSMVFERRCNELVLLLTAESTRQCLRDAVYAHGQLVDHPLFVPTPSAGTNRDPSGRRPTISAGPTTQ